MDITHVKFGGEISKNKDFLLIAEKSGSFFSLGALFANPSLWAILVSVFNGPNDALNSYQLSWFFLCQTLCVLTLCT